MVLRTFNFWRFVGQYRDFHYYFRSKTRLTSDITLNVQIKRAGTNGSACFQTSAYSLVECNFKYEME